MSGTRFRGFLVTFNETVGITPQNWGDFGSVAFGSAEYGIRQWERVAHDHIQAFLYYRNARTIDAVRKDFLPAHPHIEPMRGTVDQAIAYCSKEESRVAGPLEHGLRPAQGKRILGQGYNQRWMSQHCSNPDCYCEDRSWETFGQFNHRLRTGYLFPPMRMAHDYY